jgi:4-amino-4-deoxy-L-arabinose transferase-like glycosyltransferase
MNVQTVVAPQTGRTRLAVSGTVLVLTIAGVVLALQLAAGWRYGHLGDELYFMACAEHLDWGYVDQPPLIALVAWLTRHLLGTSVFAVHVIPAIAGAAVVWLTGLLAREMGGSRFAQALAALCTACAGVYLAMGHLFTMNVFEPLFWMGCAWLLLRIINTKNKRLWLWFGVLAGLGLENKYSMAFFAIGLIVGVALTRHRGQLLSKWFWMGALIAFLIFVPNLVWNIRHHWPFLELMHNIKASGRDVILSPVAYVVAQIMQMNPATFLVWLRGCAWLFFARKGSAYRCVGWAFVVLLGTMIVLHGKDYYAAPVYAMLFAAGAIAIDDAARNRWLGWLRFAVPVLILALTVLILPLVVPVLPVEQLTTYWAGVNRVIHLQPQEKSMFSGAAAAHLFIQLRLG